MVCCSNIQNLLIINLYIVKIYTSMLLHVVIRDVFMYFISKDTKNVDTLGHAWTRFKDNREVFILLFTLYMYY